MKYRDVLKLMLLGHNETAGELHNQIDDDVDPDYVSAVFVTCAGKRFAEDTSPASLRSFVNEARQDYEGANSPFGPLAGEALLRVAIDPENEAQLIDEVNPDDRFMVQLPMTRKILAESAELTDRVDDALDDAEKVVAMWNADSVA
ncbi:MAG TPA: hypothetical protein H9902_04145 [Candidatus Stackebrandtia faecavium]|nr:hypothetical protein [Candidatus Stackebrandtia faecavium]